MTKKYCVYLIGKCIYTGYVGVTCNKARRWKMHIHSKYPVGEYIRKHNLQFSDCTMKTLYEESSYGCFEMEKKFRPMPNIGLNVAPGGLGGERVCSAERNLKISNALKGRKHTWGHKVSNTKKTLGIAAGDKNSNAKRWKFTSPTGEFYYIVGNKEQFCDQHGLLATSLVYHLNKIVPPISNGVGRGGFRIKNETSLLKRLNSVGWMLECVNI